MDARLVTQMLELQRASKFATLLTFCERWSSVLNFFASDAISSRKISLLASLVALRCNDITITDTEACSKSLFPPSRGLGAQVTSLNSGASELLPIV
jgi:hypothetical protein